jgi:hypothetical protein
MVNISIHLVIRRCLSPFFPKTEGKLEIARKMKEMGDSAERIHTITGLTTETIQKL